jgi:3-phenylpropionate/trans-cinnamate dioxygenase ferredoxin reductase subunit
MNRHVILGGGVAGRRAAEIIRKREPEAEVVIVDEQEEAFYYRPMLGELVAGRFGLEQIISRDKARLSKLDVKVMAGTQAASLDPKAQEIVLRSGERLSFDKALIASGTRTEKIAGDDGKGRGVVYLDTLPEALQVSSLLASARNAVVYGASLQAVSAVRGLRARGIDCILVLPGERFWQGVLDPIASEIVEGRLEQEGVTLIKETEIGDLVWEDRELKAVVPSRGEKLPADVLVVATPQGARLDCLQGTGLAGERGVKVDQGLRTSHEHVFAAGDVAALPAVHTGDVTPQPGWVSAWRQGNAAGLNMTGQEGVYNGFPALRAKVLDLDVVCFGLSDARGEGLEAESGEYPYDELPYIYKKIVYKDRKVVGAVFIGDATEAGAVEGWIRKGLKADQCDKKVLDQMFLPRVQPFSATAALCPICKFRMQVEEDFDEGTALTCPVCGAEFRLDRMPNGAFRAVLAG